jgi:hypothetical protein
VSEQRSRHRQRASRCGGAMGEADEEEQGESRERRRDAAAAAAAAATPHHPCRRWDLNS